MKTLIRRTLALFMVSVSCSGMANTSLAHFPWIVPPERGSQQFEIMFSEDFEPYDSTVLEKIANEKVFAYSADGIATEVSLKLVDEKLVGELPLGKATVLLEMPFTWGMFKPGGQAFLLRYRAMSILDVAAASQVDLKEHESFGPKILLSEKQTVATFQSSPLADATIKLIGSQEAELKTNAQGQADWSYQNASGLVGLMTNSSVKEHGDWNGETYESIKCYSTLSIRMPHDAASEKSMSSNGSDKNAVARPASEFAPLPVTITSFGATKFDNKIYIFGGHLGDAHSYSTSLQSNQLLELDLAEPSSQWQVVSESDRLQGHVMLAHDGKLIRIGGFSARNADGQPHDLHSTDAVMTFDLATKQWSSLPSLPEARSSHDAILMGDTIYVVGGWKLDDPNSQSWHEAAYKMDLSADKLAWQPIANPPFQRRALSLAVLGDRIVAIGGMQNQGEISKATVYYDPMSDSWSEGPELIGEGKMIGFGTAAISGDDKIIVNCIDGSIQQLVTGSDRWELVGKTADARFFQELVEVDSNRLVSIGGANMESGKFRDLEVIDLSKKNP